MRGSSIRSCGKALVSSGVASSGHGVRVLGGFRPAIATSQTLSAVALRKQTCGSVIAPDLCIGPVRYASSHASVLTARKTPLYDLHVKHKATMVPFGGYLMPLQYADLGHGQSHEWTRTKASLFDVSHMFVMFSAFR